MNEDLQVKELYILKEIQNIRDIVTISNRARRIKWMHRVASTPKKLLSNFRNSLPFNVPFNEKTKKGNAARRHITPTTMNYKMKPISVNPYNTAYK
ncbi:hypothetical protein KJ966_15090 [bacterium]|nr:hypothetical protein [bacterium]